MWQLRQMAPHSWAELRVFGNDPISLVGDRYMYTYYYYIYYVKRFTRIMYMDI